MSSASPAGVTPAGPAPLSPEFYRLAAVLLTGTLAVVFDTTIVSVALRTLASDLHVPVSTIQWVTTGYLLALGIVIPLTGWLVDRFGGKRVWLTALTIFLAGSVGSSLAQGAGTLIAARIVQGAGGGLMLPVMQTLLIRVTGGRNLGRATALIGMPVLLGPVLGPVIGGVIVQNWSWRWIFWINIPLSLAGLILAWRFMRADAGERRTPLDATGLLLLSPAVAGLLYGLSRIGAVGGFGDPSVIVPLVLGSILLAGFVRHALHATAPLVDLRLFRLRSFTASTVLMFLSGFVLYGALLLMPLYFQDIRGQDALHTGLLLAPQGLGLLASRGLAGSLTDRIGSRWVVFTGLLLTAAGTVAFAGAGAGTSEWLLMGSLVVRGVGLGGVTLPLFATAYLDLDRAQVADASVLTRTAQQIGGSFGSAVVALVLATEVRHAAAPAQGYQDTFWWTIGFTAAAVLLALWLPGRRQLPGRRPASASPARSPAGTTPSTG